jgi:hypothetical protein
MTNVVGSSGALMLPLMKSTHTSWVGGRKPGG